MRLDHLGETRRVAHHQIVGQKDGERLVADQMAGAPHGMAEPERALLAGIGDPAGCRDDGVELVQEIVLAPLAERHFKLGGGIEMVFDGVLRAAGHEIAFLNAGGRCFLERVLDQRLIDNRQHLFGHGLCDRQKTGAEPRHRKHCLAYAFCHLALGYSRRLWPARVLRQPCTNKDRGLLLPTGSAGRPGPG